MRARLLHPAVTNAAGALLVACLAAPALAWAEEPIGYETPYAIPLPEPAWVRRAMPTVLIGAGGVQPARVELVAGQTLSWHSAAPGGVRVSFDAGVARSLLCTHLVNFSLEEGRLRSGLLENGDVASFCELAPGRYRYRIEPTGPADDPQAPADPVEGEIVVRGRPLGPLGRAGATPHR